MKMKHNIILMGMLAVATLLAGCQQDTAEESVAVEANMVKLRISTNAVPEIVEEDGMRTFLVDNKKIHWAKGEQITIGTDGLGPNWHKPLTNVSEDGLNATFEGEVDARFLTATTPTLCVYPFAAGHNENRGAITGVEVPVSQPLVVNGFANGSVPSVGALVLSEPAPVCFRVISAIIRMRLTGDTRISAVTLRGPEGSSLSGSFNVDMETGADARPEISNLSNSERQVMLSSVEPVVLDGEKHTYIYVSVLPTSLWSTDSREYEIDFTNEMGRTITRKVTFDKELESGKISTMDVIDLKADEFNYPMDFENAVNLSANGTANTYYVAASDTYCFDATVKGHGVEQNVANAPVYTAADLKIEPKNAVVLWYACEQTTNTPWANVEPVVLQSVLLKDGKVYFETPDTFVSGNVVIAVIDKVMGAGQITVDDKRCISNTNILWSWNIVCAEGYDPNANTIKAGEYEVMNRDLGATVDWSKGVGSDGKILPYVLPSAGGNIYQWGRKDPRPHIPDYASNTLKYINNTCYIPAYTPVTALRLSNGLVFLGGDNTEKYVTANYSEIDGDSSLHGFATRNPHLWIDGSGSNGHWLGNKYVNPWGSTVNGEIGVKTIDDPCPAGWKVASKNVWKTLLGLGDKADADLLDKRVTLGSDFSVSQTDRGLQMGENVFFPFNGGLRSQNGDCNGYIGSCDVECFATYALANPSGHYEYMAIVDLTSTVINWCDANKNPDGVRTVDAYFGKGGNGLTNYRQGTTNSRGAAVRCVKVK